MDTKEMLSLLNANGETKRLENLERIKDLKKDEVVKSGGRDVNNHIHTTYSFSPYSPTAAVWFARLAGLETCGIMDHDSISGAREFIKAGQIIGMKVTIGMECRVSFKNTALAAKTRINNPDQAGIVYMALHGVPHDKIEDLEEYIKPYRKLRNDRNRAMTEKLNSITNAYGLSLNFENDILPLSMHSFGGSVTERHISCALANKLTERFGVGSKLLDFMRNELKMPVTDKIAGYINNPDSEYIMYDLLGWIKSDLVPRFYIDADAECPDVREVIAVSEKIGAISAYAYLGDVGNSVTGDKRAQKFEDDYIEELFEVISDLGYRAVTYMPSRNTRDQLRRVRMLCEKHGLFQISGEDINSPRQSFVCEAMRDEMFSNLVDSTYALIAHEQRATRNSTDGMFTPQTIALWPSLSDRIAAFARYGR